MAKAVFLFCIVSAFLCSCYSENKDDNIEAMSKRELGAVLLEVSATDDLTRFSALLQQGAEIEYQDSAGFTPLLNAAFCGQPEILQLLLEQKADINALSQKNNTSLIYAADWWNGRNYEIAKILVENGIKIDHQGDNGITALMWAAKNKFSHDIAMLLIESGANTRLRSWTGEENYYAYQGYTALHFAVSSFQDEKVSLVAKLLENDAAVNAQCASGITPLFWAVSQFGSPKLVELLIQYGADINYSVPFGAFEGDTALIWAARAPSVESCKLLIAAGATIQAVNADGQTALQSAKDLVSIFPERDFSGVIMLLGTY